MAESRLPKSSSNRGSPKAKTPKRRSPSSSSGRKRSAAKKKATPKTPLLAGVALGFFVAALVVGVLLFLKDRRGLQTSPPVTSNSFKTLPETDGLSRGIGELVSSVVAGMRDGTVSPVDSATYTQCNHGGCWKVHTATYVLLGNSSSEKALIQKLKNRLRSSKELGTVNAEFQRFQWLKGEGVVVSFFHGGRLLGRYTFVLLPQDHGEMTSPLEFRPSPAPASRVSRRPMVAIVIDDVGYTKHAADLFLNLPFPVTVSVIPFTPYVGYAVSLAEARGKEVMLHIPMESGGHREAIERMESRTKGMLRVSMSDSAIVSLLRREIAAVPGAIGANNHMGSKFTRNRHKMEVVLGELKRHGLFFLDSLTSSRSVAYRTARAMGVPALRRDVFLDHTHTKEAMDRQFKRLAAIALRRGYAVAIGHPLTATYTMIKEGASKLKAMGIEIVPISRLLRRVEGAEHGRGGFQKTREFNE